ncbi:NADPH:quinone reductase [Marivirga tractuosa]|uniref:Alcohol dehydrogenase zinc-binding domain protein n=1 Tax=Marivirga tractuosa (strain ATCC 23168 / DSM 4126 / NBRC 15989 / NCIMB 1408 / VKM B-1430 / H-43) TaxID=643867 RepID=E4TLM0_MARTH|nr:NAD(P)-dependent alcohol dehydrogenase [Marivirga tractuosa]ADR22324.1 Alcohol dehydrogenase zinc-binding domain protein [Marivirga tractuosa DSM 4126]BDD13209.1 NADPH:quinone reductase [Marivirga tractuosa]
MKAIFCSHYTSPEELKIKEVPTPFPAKHEVLVKINATAINDYDWGMVRGKPYLYRLIFGLTKPRRPIAGMELSGLIEDIGEGVTKFKKGDAVYGDISEYGFGSFAEYIAINEKALVLKPEEMSFEEATAIPHAAMLAYQGLVEKGKIQKGQNILINGAGGGVGTFALQIAKMYDAEVTGVDTGEKLHNMKAIGYDEVIDYKKENFTKRGERYDLILDAKTSQATWAYLKALKPKGKYVTVGGTAANLILFGLSSGLLSILTSKKFLLVALQPNQGLSYINQLYAEGKIKPSIDGPYVFEEIPRLIQYFGEGKHTGKVVIKL